MLDSSSATSRFEHHRQNETPPTDPSRPVRRHGGGVVVFVCVSSHHPCEKGKKKQTMKTRKKEKEKTERERLLCVEIDLSTPLVVATRFPGLGCHNVSGLNLTLERRVAPLRSRIAVTDGVLGLSNEDAKGKRGERRQETDISEVHGKEDKKQTFARFMKGKGLHLRLCLLGFTSL